MRSYRRDTVAVDGGDLTVGVWGDGGPLVVAAHGITSHHLAWGLVAPSVGLDHRFVAPDLRGRGRSRDLPGPYGMDRHAEDLAAVIRAHGERAVVVGHSMGCWAAIALARHEPELVERLVLVDGGPPLAPPPGVPAEPTADQVTRVITETIGQAYARLSMTFPDRAAYRDLWQAHPSLAEWNDAMTMYADYDLVDDGGVLRPACRLEAALRDARDLYAWQPVPPEPLPVPAIFLRAERGMLDQPEGLFAPGAAGRAFPGVVERDVPGTNHYTITLSPKGAADVVTAVRSGG
ncbi:alpha/beta hydrolase [Asanoa sp. WMMD1127]|uniref:alpha/beta fold hydrolase n=1 Tax=Asanoa sp. WMMD1127 TaxID=3016107 RepID=UPI002416C92C|nr:alpha/beta hydrolase [Asanoa sp. WMMD1127]MDG4823343.1 alpha/beta hydrolase [Asanoa sp. WMMD1127]